jgi:hypothetical protein
MVIGLAVTASSIIGFLAGLLTFKRSERWCPQHGTTKVCLLCERSMPPAVSRERHPA